MNLGNPPNSQRKNPSGLEYGAFTSASNILALTSPLHSVRIAKKVYGKILSAPGSLNICQLLSSPLEPTLTFPVPIPPNKKPASVAYLSYVFCLFEQNRSSCLYIVFINSNLLYYPFTAPAVIPSMIYFCNST